MPLKEPRYRYRSERQRHIGEALDALLGRGLISEWRLVFAHPPTRNPWDPPPSSALAWFYITDGSRQRYQTREAEQFIENLCRKNGIEWSPVPPPGGRAAAQPVRELLASTAAQGHDVLGYADIAEHLRWAGIDVPPVSGNPAD